jgi:transposase
MTLTVKRETSGRCPRCRLIWTWTGRLRLRDAKCPTCEVKLARTAKALVKNKRILRDARVVNGRLRA